jgi:hypothetical protein
MIQSQHNSLQKRPTTSSTTSSTMRAPSTVGTNATTTTVRKAIDNQELLTITQVNEKRIYFNERVGLKHPYFNLIFLIEEYTKRIVPGLALDINFLLEHLPRKSDINGLDFDGLEYAHLTQLCRLMSRSCGRINFYYMLGFDCLLLEHPKTYKAFLSSTYGAQLDADISPYLSNNEINDAFYLGNLNKLTMSEGLVFLERLQWRLSMPYKTVEARPKGLPFFFFFS